MVFIGCTAVINTLGRLFPGQRFYAFARPVFFQLNTLKILGLILKIAYAILKLKDTTIAARW